jgi:hypothetical protein
MAETQNISIMAEKISDEIFSEFFWERKGPLNINWSCANEKKHKKKTHPSDVVFRYEDPYEQKHIIINFDLKSYAKGSISATSVKTAIESLALASECTQISDEWQKMYDSSDINTDIISSLFVYNHDNSFDKDFSKYLQDATNTKIPLALGNKIFIFTPQKIQYLITMVNDIQVLRGKKKLPDPDYYTFYYPTLNDKPTRNPWKSSATIEMLFSTWQIIKYKTDFNNYESNDFGIIIFYSKKGEEQEEFQYLIDYLFHYQLISTASYIEVRIAHADKFATTNFNTAIDEYKKRHQFQNDDEIVNKLDSIKIESITNVVTTFSEIEIGME